MCKVIMIAMPICYTDITGPVYRNFQELCFTL